MLFTVYKSDWAKFLIMKCFLRKEKIIISKKINFVYLANHFNEEFILYELKIYLSFSK